MPAPLAWVSMMEKRWLPAVPERTTSRCGGKDAKSCMKDGKMADCCKGKDGMKCDRKAGKDCGKGCCGSSKSEKPA